MTISERVIRSSSLVCRSEILASTDSRTCPMMPSQSNGYYRSGQNIVQSWATDFHVKIAWRYLEGTSVHGASLSAAERYFKKITNTQYYILSLPACLWTTAYAKKSDVNFMRRVCSFPLACISKMFLHAENEPMTVRISFYHAILSGSLSYKNSLTLTRH
jgi:hypothetical protein